MLLMDRTVSQTDGSAPLTLDEYLTLPDDSRVEIVHGDLCPMARSTTLHREVQFQLNTVLRAQMPRGLRVAMEEVVVL